MNDVTVIDLVLVEEVTEVPEIVMMKDVVQGMTKISKKAQPVQMLLMTGDEKIDLEMEKDLMMVVLKLKVDLLIAKVIQIYRVHL
jgi:hypothetical protein